MRQPLGRYLADHLAGSVHAIESLKNLRDAYSDEALGRFAGELLAEIEADQDVLIDLTRRAGDGPSHFKEVAAWVGEKASRMKLRHSEPSGLGTFETIEHLELGIQGKWGLWRALGKVAAGHPALRDTDFELLAHRAADQYARLEWQRIEMAQRVLAGRKERATEEWPQSLSEAPVDAGKDSAPGEGWAFLMGVAGFAAGWVVMKSYLDDPSAQAQAREVRQTL